MVRSASPRDADFVLDGIAASPGIGIGRALVVQRERVVVPRFSVAADQAAAEVERLRRGVERSKQQLDRIRGAAAHAEIVDAILHTQGMILDDRQLFEDAARRILEERCNAESAVDQELRRLEHLFDTMQDAYLRERRADVGAVIRRLLLNLMGREVESLPELSEPSVVVADDLSPAETAQLDRRFVVAFATQSGGRASHTAIMAGSLGIPAVMGVDQIVARVRGGDTIIVDGSVGRVWVRPSKRTVGVQRERARGDARRAREWLRHADLPAETRDGRRVGLLANIERAEDVASARRHGARGVGLFRTEFLYMNRAELPDEEEQVRHYRSVLEGMAPDPAVIRTLDLGADKLPSGIGRRGESNPALGLRGIRLGLADRNITHVQMRALLRASVHGRLRILLPLVTGVDEVRAARACLDQARVELEREGCPAADDVQLGIVMETPAAVAMADFLAREADFFSIGTNDLIQYTVAVDRDNESVAYLYDPLHPAVLRSIRAVAEHAHRAGKPVAMCGEMAGEPLYSMVLIGLGVDELSMNAPAIPKVKRILRGTTLVEARALAAELLGLPTAAEVKDRLRKEMLRSFPDEFEAL